MENSIFLESSCSYTTLLHMSRMGSTHADNNNIKLDQYIKEYRYRLHVLAYEIYRTISINSRRMNYFGKTM